MDKKELTVTELKLLKKDEIIEKFMKLQAEIQNIQGIYDKLESIEAKFEKLQSDISVTKTVNSRLCEEIVTLEKRCSASEQYSRRECLEIMGIPGSVKQENLESEALKIFQKIDVVVDPENVEACHRLGGKDSTKVIIKLSRRKDIGRIFANKKKLKDVDWSDIGYDNEAKVYVNESLCVAYRKLWYKCKLLRSNDFISQFWTSNGTVKLRIKERSPVKAILHENDLNKMFPDVDFEKLE